jgi:hypothetical protein
MKNIKSHKTYLCISVFLILILFSVSCGVLTNKTAREAFSKENPTYKIIHSYTGEGWDGVGYHHFEYKKPNDETVYKEMWCFVQQEDGNWKVTGKSKE